MTIKWGDPIECNGVRPDWLRDGERLQWAHSLNASPRWTETLSDELNFATGKPHQISHIRLPADHPAYVALARGFTPWSGGESAPDDWDGGAVLLRDGEVWTHPVTWGDCGTRSVIGYFKHCRDYVRIVPFTRAEWDAVPDYTAWAQSVGLIRPETLAERFTRETGYEVTEAVEAALNWKET